MTTENSRKPGFDATDCSLAFTPEEQAELDEALKTWIPYWRKPTTPNEWDKLVEQKASFAVSAVESHKSAVELKAPMFLRRLLAKSRYRCCRNYSRTKRRAEWEKLDSASKLLNAIMRED